MISMYDIAVDQARDKMLDGNETLTPTSTPIPSAATNEKSLIILSWSMFCVGMLVLTFFIWNIRTQIKNLLVKVCSYLRSTLIEKKIDFASNLSIFESAGRRQ